jgi:hypothetical protein
MMSTEPVSLVKTRFRFTLRQNYGCLYDEYPILATTPSRGVKQYGRTRSRVYEGLHAAKPGRVLARRTGRRVFSRKRSRAIIDKTPRVAFTADALEGVFLITNG